MIEYKHFSEQYLDQIVDFWNNNFNTRRNFFPITKEIFTNRFLNKKEPLAHFIPENYILAITCNKIAGIVHFAIYNPAISQYLYPNLKGDIGSIYFLCVDKDFRHQGIGTGLWNIANEQLKSCKHIVIDGQCINDFYGNVGGPSTPFFGTPEGISIPLDDTETINFFLKRGFSPRYEAASLELVDFSIKEIESDLINIISEQGFELHNTSDFLPQIGLELNNHQKTAKKYVFESLFLTLSNVVNGQITFYPMSKVLPTKYGIYSTEIIGDFKGKKLGSSLVKLAILRLQAKGATSLEVVTLRSIEHNAQSFYEKLRFKLAEKWAVF